MTFDNDGYNDYVSHLCIGGMVMQELHMAAANYERLQLTEVHRATESCWEEFKPS